MTGSETYDPKFEALFAELEAEQQAKPFRMPPTPPQIPVLPQAQPEYSTRAKDCGLDAPSTLERRYHWRAGFFFWCAFGGCLLAFSFPITGFISCALFSKTAGILWPYFYPIWLGIALAALGGTALYINHFIYEWRTRTPEDWRYLRSDEYMRDRAAAMADLAGQSLGVAFFVAFFAPILTFFSVGMALFLFLGALAFALLCGLLALWFLMWAKLRECVERWKDKKTSNRGDLSSLSMAVTVGLRR